MTDLQMYTASVIADSVSPEGHRLTTVRVVYPHAVHKDMLRHRCMNRNVESFRAQPPEKLIEALRDGHAFMPDAFATRTKGMGQGLSLMDEEQKQAEWLWERHIKSSTEIAEQFLQMGIAKQQVNFLLQDLCPLTEVITATDWSNFYALRTELKDDGTPMARPEVYKTAVAIRDAIDRSDPESLDYGQLHLPMVTEEELKALCESRSWPDEQPLGAEDFWIGVSAGRCARISYGDFHWWEESASVSFDRSRKLLSAGHMSPFEQQARCFSAERWGVVEDLQVPLRDSAHMGLHSRSEAEEIARQLEYSGNLHGWIPARKEFPNEWDYGLLREAV